MIICNKKVLSLFNPNNYILRQRCNFHNHQVENNRAFFSKRPRCISSYGSGHIISGPCQILVFKIFWKKKTLIFKVLFFYWFLISFLIIWKSKLKHYRFTWSKGPFHYIANKILILGEVGWQCDQITAASWSRNTCQPSLTQPIVLITILFVTLSPTATFK